MGYYRATEKEPTVILTRRQLLKNMSVAPLLASASGFLFAGVSCNSAEWLQDAENDVPVVLQIITGVLSILSVAQGKGTIPGAVATALNSYADTVQTDLKLVQTLINDFKAAAAADKQNVLGKIDAALATAQKDLSGLLTGTHIQDETTQTAIASALALALTTIAAIQSLIPAAVNPKNKLAAKHAVRPLKPATLKARYNSATAAFPQAAIQ
jgi:hypothetical protein